MKIVHASQGSINNRLSHGKQREKKLSSRFLVQHLPLSNSELFYVRLNQHFRVSLISNVFPECVSSNHKNSGSNSFNLIIKRFF